MAPFLKKIVIAGGGTAGWMTAAALSNHVPRDVSIQLVESDQIGTIGVGEASIPPLIGFNQLIGLEEAIFMRETSATFKMGIEFTGWDLPGEAYLHPFGTYGTPLGLTPFHQAWLRARTLGQTAPITDYSLNTLLAAQNRFLPPSPDPGSVQSTLGYAYHFDAGKYAALLRKMAEQRGVVRTEGLIADVTLSADSGAIASLTLKDGQVIAGDLFVDCTGLRAALIEGTLNSGFVDWSNALPCDRAVAVQSTHETAPVLPPYTRSIAMRAGWQWQIPLRHRTGNGLVYSSRHLSDEEAIAYLMRHLPGKPQTEPRLIRFTSGRRKAAWVKNCVAIGLSAGFLEPLESTSIHLIQKGVLKLLQFMPEQAISDTLRTGFNRQTEEDYEDVKDFLILHYKANRREGEAFWDHCRHMPVSQSLSQRMALFEESGRLFIEQKELFKEASWLAVMLGQGLTPRSFDPLANATPQAELFGRLDTLRALLRKAVDQANTHETVLRRLFATA